MKKILVVLLVMLSVLLIAQDVINFDASSRLGIDANRKAVQAGRYISLLDGNAAAYEHVAEGNFTVITKWYATNDITIDSLVANWKIVEDEHLNETDFATHANWDVTNDFEDDSLSVRWTWVDAVTSTLTQVAADQALSFEASQDVVLTYTIYDSVAVVGGVVTTTVGGFCETSTISTTAGTHTYYITTKSSAATDDVVFTVKADADVTAGKFAFDDISIYSYPISYLSQPCDSLNLAFEAMQDVVLSYTIYDSVTVAGGSAPLTFVSFGDTTSLATTAGDHTYYLTTDSSAATDSIYFAITPDSYVTAGEYSIDDISIGSYNESPLSIVTGSDVTLTIPKGTVNMVVDPRGTDIKIEIGSSYYIINSETSIPCSGIKTITLGNDSGGTATIDMCFVGI